MVRFQDMTMLKCISPLVMSCISCGLALEWNESGVVGLGGAGSWLTASIFH